MIVKSIGKGQSCLEHYIYDKRRMLTYTDINALLTSVMPKGNVTFHQQSN